MVATQSSAIFSVTEGRLANNGILLKIEEINEIDRRAGDPSQPVKITCRCGHNLGKFFIMIYDHRRAVIDAYEKGCSNGNWKDFEQAFKNSPGLVAYRIKHGTQYIVLVDIGTPDVQDGGPGLYLGRRHEFTGNKFDVCRSRNGKVAAIHATSGVCIMRRSG